MLLELVKYCSSNGLLVFLFSVFILLITLYPLCITIVSIMEMICKIIIIKKGNKDE